MPHKHEIAHVPADPISPSNSIIIQARVDPTKCGIKKNVDADWRVPPFTLVFTKKQIAATTGISSTSIQHATKRRRREGEIHDTITNFYDFQHDPQHTPNCDLRCLGVSYDGIADAAGAKRHPDSVGRYATIVSGAVTIICNKADLKDCHVGDLLQWEPEDCGLTFNGLPRNWSCPKISKAPSAHTPGSVDLGNELFGSSVDLNLDTAFNDDKSENGPVELSREIQTVLRHRMQKLTKAGEIEPTPNVLMGFVDRFDKAEIAHHPKKFVDVVATFFFSLIGEENPSDWENKLYNPASPWWCECVRPSNAFSMDWVDHMIGYGGIMPLKVNEAGNTVSFTSERSEANNFCGGRSEGWFLRLIAPMISSDSWDCKWAWKSETARKKAQAAATPNQLGSLIAGNAELSDILRKSYTGQALTEHEMWHLIMGRDKDMETEDGTILKQYTVPFLKAGSTSRLMSWVAASVAGMYVTGRGAYKNVGAYGATEDAFKEKRKSCQEHIRNVFGRSDNKSFLFSELTRDLFFNEYRAFESFRWDDDENMQTFIRTFLNTFISTKFNAYAFASKVDDASKQWQTLITSMKNVEINDADADYHKWYKRILAKRAGMGLHDGESRVFGMLLEKSVFENAARVLLMPGFSS